MNEVIGQLDEEYPSPFDVSPELFRLRPHKIARCRLAIKRSLRLLFGDSLQMKEVLAAFNQAVKDVEAKTDADQKVWELQEHLRETKRRLSALEVQCSRSEQKPKSIPKTDSAGRLRPPFEGPLN